MFILFNYRFTSFLPHKKFSWTDFGRVYTHTYIYLYTPRRYAPAGGDLTWPPFNLSSKEFERFPIPRRELFDNRNNPSGNPRIQVIQRSVIVISDLKLNVCKRAKRNVT